MVQTEEKYYTDQYNANQLIEKYGDRLRYAGSWFIYDGVQWKEDRTRQVYRYAQDVIQGYYREASEIEDSREREILVDFARRSESLISKKHMVETATFDERVAYTLEDFDTDSTLYLLNTRNKTINLKTGTDREHRPDDMITRCANVEYVPVSPGRFEGSRWLRFIDEITCGDKELARYLQKCLGYSISGDTGEQAWFICYGSGANGKSVLIEVIKTVLGEYATTIPIEALLSKKNGGKSNEIAELRGMRFVTASESDSGTFDTGLVKRLTGDETMRVRRLYENSFEFKPQAHFWIATNHKPDIQDTSEGQWRRVKLIPFNASFLANPERNLRQTLLSESDIVLQWLLEGYSMWQAEGLQTPEIVQQAIDEYRKETDPLNDFFEEKCKSGPGMSVAFSELYDAYREYAGYGAVNKNQFGRMLTERGYKKKNSGGLKVFGIELVPSSPPPFMAIHCTSIETSLHGVEEPLF